MYEHDQAPTPADPTATHPPASPAPAWAPPPPAPDGGYPPPAWAPPTQPYPGPPAGARPSAPGAWDHGPYGAAPAGGGGVPPYGYGPGWTPGPPSGELWPPSAVNRAARRRRRRTALAAGATAGLFAVAGVGALVGHAAWQTPRSSAASPPIGSGAAGSGAAGSGSAGSGSAGSGASPFGSSNGSTAGTGTSAVGAPSNAAAIVEKVSPGLVDINTTLGYQGQAAAGTGMVLTSNGEILTNNHVIDGATSIRVTDIGDGRTYAANVVGYDRTQDVAVLQLVNASGLRTVPLGDSSGLTRAEAVVGIGNAGGTGGTPSYAAGSVTALGQSITASNESGGDAEKLVGLIETNADIQAGDSGGSLVDARGQVIGMDTAASAGTQFQAATATSYAIPINTAVGIAQQIESGRASSVVHIGTTALLGVEVAPAGQGTSVFGGSTGSGGSGALIAGVVPDSPAAASGLTVGDTITGVDGRTVTSAGDLTSDLGRDKPGDSVQLTYQDSSGQSHHVSVKLASGPPQ